MADTRLGRMDATGQAELLRTGQASAPELVDDAIARIEAVNPRLNAVIHERFEQAREEARAPLPHGPFQGVPFLLKDLDCPSAGDPLHCGATFLKAARHVARADGYLTARFRAAGLVVLGRTNTPEFGTTITTEPVAYGPTRNPWDPERSTGGSSGGSAAAVASLMVPAAHASDGGGSIRIPASECGLVGLKPTRGRVTMGPDRGENWAGATTQGVITRSVRDTAAMLDAISGPAPGDPYGAPTPERPFAAEVGADPGALRIGLLDHPPVAGVEGHPDTAAAVATAGSLLEQLGHHVDRSHPRAMGEEAVSHHFVTVLAASLAADLAEWEQVIGRPLTPDDVEPANWLFAQMGRSMSSVQYLESVRWQQRWNRRMAAWWEQGFDLLCCPVVNGPPPPLGYLSDPTEGLSRVTQMMQFTSQFNVTGQPAISLPLHWNDDGLPIGVQLVAAFGREDLLLRVASQLEAAVEWPARVPPVHA
jgi:amidase